MRVLLVIPGLALLFAGIYCILGKGPSGPISLDVVPHWLSALACIAGLGAIVYGAGRHKF